MTTKNQQKIELQSAIEWIKIAMQQIQRPMTWNHEAESRHVQALITAATSSSTRSEVPEWLPIESAPRDKHILMTNGIDVWITYFSLICPYGATHWQPLPQPPKSTAQAEGDQ